MSLGKRESFFSVLVGNIFSHLKISYFSRNFIKGNSFFEFIFNERRSLFEFESHFLAKLELHVFPVILQKTLRGRIHI